MVEMEITVTLSAEDASRLAIAEAFDEKMRALASEESIRVSQGMFKVLDD